MMHLSATGEVLDYSFHKSVIHSKERMTYEDVQKVLDGDRMLEQRYAHIVPHSSGTSDIWQRSFKSAGSNAVRSISILPEPLLTYDEEGMVHGHHEIRAALLASHCRGVHDPRQRSGGASSGRDATSRAFIGYTKNRIR